MVQTQLHWLKICIRITHSILEAWLSDCPRCLNNSTFSDWFGLCPLVLSEMLPSQFVKRLVAAAMSKKQQGCDCTKFVSLHFNQASTAILAGFCTFKHPTMPSHHPSGMQWILSSWYREGTLISHQTSHPQVMHQLLFVLSELIWS